VISWGAIAMLGAAVSYAATTIYLRVIKPADHYSTALGQQIVSTVAAVALMVFWEPQQYWLQSVSVWFALAGLAVVATAVPNILFFKLVSCVSASKAVLAEYFMPIAAGLYAMVFIGEALRLQVVIGGFIVLIALWLTTRHSNTSG
jgi:drug/metabolite transporter (DMT)-like permease